MKKSKCPIKNYDIRDSEDEFININPYVPQWPFRNIVYGPSGCGKTNYLLNLIYDYLAYSKLYVYARMLSEKKYQQLQENFKKMEDKKKCSCSVFSDNENDIIDVNDLDEKVQNLIVIDDFGNSNDSEFWKKIKNLFTMSRKKNTSIIFIAHDIKQTPKEIKGSANYVTLFGYPNKHDRTNFLREFPLDITNDEFKKLYKPITENKYNFLLIDKQTDDSDMKYRINFDNELVQKSFKNKQK